MTSRSDPTPVISVELRRADVAELINADPLLSASTLATALGGQASAVWRAGLALRYPSKAVLFQQGEPGRSLLFVLKGEVRLFARKHQYTVELGVARAGEFFGEDEVLSGVDSRGASAVAQHTVEAVEFQRSALVNPQGELWPGLKALLELVQRERRAALDEMADFLNRW